MHLPFAAITIRSTISANETCEFGTCGPHDYTACNYNPTILEDDGSCLLLDALGGAVANVNMTSTRMVFAISIAT